MVISHLLAAILGAFVGYVFAMYGDLAVTPARDLPLFGEPANDPLIAANLVRGGRKPPLRAERVAPTQLSAEEIERRTRPHLARLTADEWRDFDHLRGAWRDAVSPEGV